MLSPNANANEIVPSFSINNIMPSSNISDLQSTEPCAVSEHVSSGGTSGLSCQPLIYTMSSVLSRPTLICRHAQPNLAYVLQTIQQSFASIPFQNRGHLQSSMAYAPQTILNCGRTQPNSAYSPQTIL